jgi:hypothetical protein
VKPVSLTAVGIQLRSKIGDAFNNIAVMLGGKPCGNQGKAKGWSINRNVLNAVLDFAEASQKSSRQEHQKDPRTRTEDRGIITGRNEAKTSCMKW